MLIDARTLPSEEVIETEICIIGAGAAGVTLAREFINQPYRVCLLESGGLDFDEATQSLYNGENIGTPYFPLKETRARYLGGSTNLWGGWSRPLDDLDFEHRPWMQYSGWPFTKAELIPYYDRAQKASKLGPFQYDFAYWEEALNQLQCQPLPFLGDEIVRYIWQVIPPTHLRFGEAYRAEIEQASNINTYLHANVVEIETNDTAQEVTRLCIASLHGKKFWIEAKVFILAAGGIESARLLLVSNKVQSAGVGNQYDLVGRFFMEHPYLTSGTLVANPAARSRSYLKVDEIVVATGFGLSKAVQEREKILNFSTRLLQIQEEWIAALKRLRFRNRQTKIHQAFPTLHEGQELMGEAPVMEDLGKVIRNFDRVVAKAYAKLSKKPFQSRNTNLYRTHLISEQAPNPDSRITLGAERDRLGLNCVQLDWRLSEIDKYTIARSQQIVAAEFARFGIGQLQVELTDDEDSWQSITASYHHMGTTRMSTNPKQGVVNEHCQVHGINNLYIASSSVFPTSGLSNPTLTIIALAIRLADQIKTRMGTASISKKLEATSSQFIT